MLPLHFHPSGFNQKYYFEFQMKPIFFFHNNPKIAATNSLYFGIIIKKNYRFLYTNFDFLIYFHNSPIPNVIFLFFTSGEQTRSNFEVKLHKTCLRVKVNSPVLQSARPKAVALASYTIVDKIIKNTVDSTRKDN